MSEHCYENYFYKFDFFDGKCGSRSALSIFVSLLFDIRVLFNCLSLRLSVGLSVYSLIQNKVLRKCLFCRHRAADVG